eukprot:228611_1
MATSSLSDNNFTQIDQALAIYYKTCGRNDYYDEKGNGKFMKFVTKNAFDPNMIELELGDNVKPEECLYIEMDQDFPLHEQEQNQTNSSRNTKIFNIIKHCYKYGSAPNTFLYESKQNVIVDTRCNQPFDECESAKRIKLLLDQYQKIISDKKQQSDEQLKNSADKLISNIVWNGKYSNVELMNDFYHIKYDH